MYSSEIAPRSKRPAALQRRTIRAGTLYTKGHKEMAPLAPDNTGRFYVDYHANGHDHTAMFRFNDGGSGVPDAGFVENVLAFFEDAASFFPTDAEVIGFRVSAAGSPVSNTYSAVPPAIAGSNPPSVAVAPAYIDFVGRSPDGRRVRVALMGVAVNPVQSGGVFSNYRLTAVEDARIATLVTDLANMEAVTISNQIAVWKGYGNLGYNAYWQRQAR